MSRGKRHAYEMPAYWRRPVVPRAARLAARYTMMALIAVVMVGPFLWFGSIAIRGAGNIYQIQLIPDEPTLENFKIVWKEFGIGRSFLNSVWVAALSVGLNLLFASLAAYPLARLTFPGRKLIFALILSTLFLPFQVYMIPLYLLCWKMGLQNTFTGVVLPFSVSAFGVYLLRQYYLTIPSSLDEAARVDGASEFRIWAQVMLPLTKPALASLAVFAFVANWSNFLWPLIILQDERKYTLPVMIAKLTGAFIDRTAYLAAGSVIAILPVIVLFWALQRFFIGGITLGAVKG
ncbi:MAG: carbohydrate ABC transporter permease [bacterium]